MLPAVQTTAFARIMAPQSVRAFSSSAVSFRAVSYVERLAQQGYTAPPKRPASSYGLFLKDQFQNHPTDLPSTGDKLNVTELSSTLVRQWKELPSSERAKWAKQSEQLSVQYKKDFESWAKQYSTKDIAQIEAIIGKTIRFPGSKEVHRRAARDQSGERPRPLTAFFLFLADRRTKTGSSHGSETEFAKGAGAEWKQMSDAQKKPFVDEAARLRAEYVEWKETQGAK